MFWLCVLCFGCVCCALYLWATVLNRDWRALSRCNRTQWSRSSRYISKAQCFQMLNWSDILIFQISIQHGENFMHEAVNSNTTGTITPMFSSYDWMKPNLKQKAGTARGKWLVRKDWGKLRGVKSLFLSENMLEK